MVKTIKDKFRWVEREETVFHAPSNSAMVKIVKVLQYKVKIQRFCTQEESKTNGNDFPYVIEEVWHDVPTVSLKELETET